MIKFNDMIEKIKAYFEVGFIVGNFCKESDALVTSILKKPGKWRMYYHGEEEDHIVQLKSSALMVFEGDGERYITWFSGNYVHDGKTDVYDKWFFESGGIILDHVNVRVSRVNMVKLNKIHQRLSMGENYVIQEASI